MKPRYESMTIKQEKKQRTSKALLQFNFLLVPTPKDCLPKKSINGSKHCFIYKTVCRTNCDQVTLFDTHEPLSVFSEPFPLSIGG